MPRKPWAEREQEALRWMAAGVGAGEEPQSTIAAMFKERADAEGRVADEYMRCATYLSAERQRAEAAEVLILACRRKVGVAWAVALDRITSGNVAHMRARMVGELQPVAEAMDRFLAAPPAAPPSDPLVQRAVEAADKVLGFVGPWLRHQQVKGATERRCIVCYALDSDGHEEGCAWVEFESATSEAVAALRSSRKEGQGG